jgi:2-hydroxychromene-2-carboxylate isomerase
MSFCLDREGGLRTSGDGRFALECPYCDVYAHMTPQSVPDVDLLLRTRPTRVGLVFQCDSCTAPVFLRFSVREYTGTRIELYSNFAELERPKETFPFNHLPDETAALFREALGCYSDGHFNAFASMCRRTAESAFTAAGDGGKLAAFDIVMSAKKLAGLDDELFQPARRTLFDGSPEHAPLPELGRAEAGVLLELSKDLFYQLLVRRAKLTRALKVRQFFVRESAADRDAG